MGWLGGLLGKSPLSERRIQKVVKLVTNPYCQPDVRMREMNRLVADGSPAALRGVLKRFATNANGAIADEDEKRWLEDTLVDHIGKDAKEPLEHYIRSEKQLTYALRAYHRIFGRDRAVELFLQVLERFGPEDHRTSEAKLQLIWQLSDELEEPRVLPALAPFLLDHSDEVRWAVLDLLERGVKAEGLSDASRQEFLTHLQDLVTDDGVSRRIQMRSAEFLCTHEWPLPEGGPEALSACLDEEYFLDKKHFIRRRAKKKE